MRGRALIGGTFAALLLVLAGDNLYRFGRLQRTEDCDYTLCLRPRSIGSNALGNRHAVVAGRYAVYYQLGKRIAGATLTIPPWMEKHRWHIERLAHVRIAVADAPMVLDPEKARALRKEAEGQVRWLRERDGKEKVWQDLHLLYGAPGDDYVIAETGEAHGDLFLVPATRYAEAVAP